ncbi:syndecan-like isoform X1 [Vespa mandarinia]|uniref:syndecan-like isoform X1 n=1 Tax=Vespa mandarinia TaxID=7446 RepID=UPI00161837C3|nr:syndecan-like isoform X1 [Vespa mandarinia]
MCSFSFRLMEHFYFWNRKCKRVASYLCKEQNEKGERTLGNSNYNSFPDDLYLDDQEASEGSGRGGSEGRDDLEASGSGLGPDDEDGDDEHEFDTTNNRIEPVPKKPIEPKEPYSIDESNNNNKVQTNEETINRVDNEEVDVIEPSTGEDEHVDNIGDSQDVYIMNPKHEDRASSFFAQPGVLAAVIGGAVVGLLCAILVVMFIVYRMRKKDEGSYALDEPRRSPAAQAFPKPGAPHHNREFYA